SGLAVEAVLDTVAQPLAGQYYVGAVPGGAWAGARSSARLLRITGTAVTQALPTPDGANVTCMLGLANGTAWAGTTQNLLRYDGGAWSIANLSGVTPARVMALAADASGGIWVGTDSKGAVRYDPSSGNVQGVTGLPGGAVTAIAVAPNGDAWVGVQSVGV